MSKRKRLSLKETVRFAVDREVENSGGAAGAGADIGGTSAGVILRTIWYLIRGVPDKKEDKR
jgi:hypothetical protein